jgi:hypothetical protein
MIDIHAVDIDEWYRLTQEIIETTHIYCKQQNSLIKGYMDASKKGTMIDFMKNPPKVSSLEKLIELQARYNGEYSLETVLWLIDKVRELKQEAKP